MAVDRKALDQALTRELVTVTDAMRPLRFRLGDAYLPEGTAAPVGSRLRCCSCGFSAPAGPSPEPCGLCGSRAWELMPALSLAR